MLIYFKFLNIVTKSETLRSFECIQCCKAIRYHISAIITYNLLMLKREKQMQIFLINLFF